MTDAELLALVEGAFAVARLSQPIRRTQPPSHLRQTSLFTEGETRAVLEFLRHIAATRSEALTGCGVKPKQVARALRNWEGFLACSQEPPPRP